MTIAYYGMKLQITSNHQTDFLMKERIVSDTIGHVPREISRSVWFFLEIGESDRKSMRKKWRSPILNDGLEIILKVTFSIPDSKRRFLDRLKDMIEVNYQIRLQKGTK